MAAPCSRPVSSGRVPAPVVAASERNAAHAHTRTGTNTQKDTNTRAPVPKGRLMEGGREGRETEDEEDNNKKKKKKKKKDDKGDKDPREQAFSKRGTARTQIAFSTN
ncbi:uncharacterized protein TRIREDRAFT_105420 [Trichoderma reesei QM6a]|uniref:Predicted protein n=2 Tax=Hypocrea jecorina TaxID=51453 RepID=G0REH9_HYPJQ|nr:uncharacterized protein TRIREDRAFT_105420 [Trichoderma reesei QM6a]EGR50367.1 predicted protein [Trichoderma reesei QM6a]ETS03780.1 hypothetical protein M419DRAFT_128192 [Trichoderma reesei RUT C-30]